MKRIIVNVYHSPVATAIPNACDMEYELIQCSLPHLEFEFAELESLNLSVHVPAVPSQGLPVLVFIHGGGFTTGSHVRTSKVPVNGQLKPAGMAAVRSGTNRPTVY